MTALREHHSVSGEGAVAAPIETARKEAETHYRRLHEGQWSIRLAQVLLRQQFAGYLAHFYNGRDMPFDRRLILRGGVRTRFQSQGAALDLYVTAPEAVQRQKLADYRQEMAAVTSFLRHQVASQPQATSEPTPNHVLNAPVRHTRIRRSEQRDTHPSSEALCMNHVLR